MPVQSRFPPARDGHSAVVWGHKMYIFGGFEEEAQRFSQETYVYDFPTARWSLFNTTVSLLRLLGARESHLKMHLHYLYLLDELFCCSPSSIFSEPLAKKKKEATVDLD